ncbi:MAG TPA: hypothetical protein VGE74_03270 [Gemmata sp.]
MSHAHASFYHGPPLPVPSAAAPAAGPFGVTFEGLEVTQAIQDMAHTVPLVAGKATVVRVYLGTTTTTPVTVRGVLRVRSSAPGATWIQVTAIRPVLLNPAENGHVRVKREALDKSLNFILPAPATAAGDWTVALFRVQQVTPPGAALPIPVGASRVVRFRATPPLRVRVIGVRYRDATHGPVRSFEPAPKDFVLIRSWLGRAYPVASVVWSQAVVDGPNSWPFDAAQTNAFVRAIRAQDIASGGDRRTHYYGLVDDAAGLNFMRGLASGIPTGPDPSTVASGPTGTSNFGWDFDGSYGDWYTGHELGHTFGRLHAMFCGALGGGPYPYPNGQLSPNDGSFVGFDFGDAANGVPMRALPGVAWHDVMTYCENQWVSLFTYAGLRDRIVAEGALPAHGPAPGGVGGGAAGGPSGVGGAGAGAGAMNVTSIHAVAMVNATRGTAAFQFVSPLPGAAGGATPGAAANANYTLRLKKADGAVLGEYPAPFYPDACTDPGHDATGLIDATIPAHADAAVLELVHAGKVVATYSAPAAPGPVQNIQPAAPSGGGGAGPGTAPAFEDPVITWTPGAAIGAAAAAIALGVAGAGAGAAGPTYTVQISTDDGHSWSTIGVGLKQPHVRVDRTMLEGAQQVKVRVTATDGFRATTTDQTLRAEDM